MSKPLIPARVLIGVPARDTVATFFAYDLAHLTGYTGVKWVGPGQPIEALRIFFSDGTLIAPQRYDIVMHAFATKATHILWLDSDMRFPADTLIRLLARNRECVGANYSGRRVPSGPVAHRGLEQPVTELVYTHEHSTGLERVDGVGMGCLLTRMTVFEKVAAPWFPIQWGVAADGSWAMMGEDMGFFRLALKQGVACWIDHDLTKDVRHVGTFEYRYQHAEMMKDELREKVAGRYIVPEDRVAEEPKVQLVKG